MSRSWLAVNGPQNGSSGGKSSETPRCGSATIASTRSESAPASAGARRDLAGRASRRARSSRRDRRAPTGRCAACRRCRAPAASARRRRRRGGSLRRHAPCGDRRRPPAPPPRNRRRPACRQARRLRRLRRDPCRVRLERIRSRLAPMARAASRSRVTARGLARLAVDPVDLDEPGAGRGLHSSWVIAPRASVAERAAARRPWPARTARGSAALAAACAALASCVVVCALGRAQRVIRGRRPGRAPGSRARSARRRCGAVGARSGASVRQSAASAPTAASGASAARRRRGHRGVTGVAGPARRGGGRAGGASERPTAVRAAAVPATGAAALTRMPASDPRRR